ncbi:MAG TPA: hypothetical protein VHL80_09120 [Polyangia bacterium]|nr:hypothetical protein [Polyangia bacterium]
MSFSIVCTRAGAFRIVLRGELSPASTSLLRRELATLLVARPSEVELSVPRRVLVPGAWAALLESFFEILWSRGCRLTMVSGGEPSTSAVSIADRAQLRRVLVASGESSVAR